tara:strand:- start:1390 stop:1896 length:507 start_codon:yes stop_codon:yes gene_type:complete
MKENELRGVIRKQIRKVLSEAPRLGAGGAELQRGLGKIGDRTSRFTKRQRIQSVLPVLKKFNIQTSDLPLLKAALSKLYAADAAAAAEPEMEENYTAGVDDGDAAMNEALDSKGEKLEKTQAFQMLKRALGPKNANQQAEFVFDLIDKLGLDASAKQRIRMKAQRKLK